LVALAMLGALDAVAAAAAPAVVIEHPVAGSWTNTQSLPISGTTNDIADAVVVKIHEGASTGPVLQRLTTPPPLFGVWETAPESPLKDGEYTAVAEQTLVTETGTAEVAFTVDTIAPQVTLNAALINSGIATFGGKAGTEAGDLAPVTLKIYQGTTARATA
jgi:hypothetical protein